MSVEDVGRLPWWEWRLLIEGLDAEMRADAGEPPREVPAGPAEAHANDARLLDAGVSFRTVEGGSS